MTPLLAKSIIAIFSNVLWIFLIPNPTIGASGLLYAVEGVLLGFSLFNGLQFLNFSKFKKQTKLYQKP
jgi:membrane associated rhomboid family serine protease